MKTWKEMSDCEAEIFLYKLADLAQDKNIEPEDLIKFIEQQRRNQTMSFADIWEKLEEILEILDKIYHATIGDKKDE